MLTSIWRDLTHAVRSLAKARAFTFVCVMTLGIGMAPIIAIQYGSRIFTTPPRSVDIERPTKLVELVTTSVGKHRATSEWSYPDFVDLRNAQTGVSITGWAVGVSEVTLPDAGTTKTTAETMFVSADYFKTIDVALTRGPGFVDQATPDPVVILGHAFWQRRLASDPAIVGKILTLDDVPHVVAGIAPSGFTGHLALQDTGLFLPLERHPAFLADKNARFDRGKTLVHMHGRLAPGVSVEQASAAVSAVTSQLAREYAATNEYRAGIVAPYHAIGSLADLETSILVAVWQGMTAIPLLIVCLNVSGMVQARSAMRERELSIRQAIGASRGRLIQHLLAEAVVLAGAGGALASIVLFNLPGALSWWIGEPMPAHLQAALKVDLRMIAVCAGLCLATSLVFGWLPALRFSRPVIMTVLKDEAGTGGLRAGRTHRVAAALQIAVAVPILVLSFMSLERVRATAGADLGFAAEQLYAAPITNAHQIRSMRDNLANTNGVAAVTIADGLPLDFRYRIASVSAATKADQAPTIVSAHVTRVADGYLDTMRIELMRGRAFGTNDQAGAPLVTILSKPLADKLFPGADAIGQPIQFRIPGQEDKTPPTITVVGITADFPTSQMSTDREQLLLPLAQHPDVLGDAVPVDDDRGGKARLMLIARSTVGEPPTKMTAALENVMREADPDFERNTIVTGAGLRQFSMDDFLTQFGVGAMAGGVTLLLAALGIYGVVGLMVTARTREIAMRAALGASRARVIRMILFDVVKLVGPGVAVGVLITLALVRLDNGVRLSSIEPLAYVAGAAVAVLTAVLASLAPARRAASIQPMVAMRST